MSVGFGTVAFANTDISASRNSNPIGIQFLPYGLLHIHVVTTGTAAGTLNIQFSNDDGGTAQPALATITNWNSDPTYTTSVSGAGNYSFNIPYAGARWCRIAYTASSGTGTIAARWSGR